MVISTLAMMATCSPTYGPALWRPLRVDPPVCLLAERAGGTPWLRDKLAPRESPRDCVASRSFNEERTVTQSNGRMRTWRQYASMGAAELAHLPALLIVALLNQCVKHHRAGARARVQGTVQR